jgi:hypothetical protein
LIFIMLQLSYMIMYELISKVYKAWYIHHVKSKC